MKESKPNKPRSIKRPRADRDNDAIRTPRTTWGHVADWYEEHLGTNDTYHEQVVLPNITRALALDKNDTVLDLPCGQGYFASVFADQAKSVIAIDISHELVSYAERNKKSNMTYVVSPSHKLGGVEDKSISKIAMILGIQNIEKVNETFAECARVLMDKGELHIVMNHPAFRIPKKSSWEWDARNQKQYRRIEQYLSESQEKIDMHPGKWNDDVKKKQHTVSFHRPLQYYFKLLGKHGFAVDRLEEWISHRESNSGPRKQAENVARKEIPLFLYLRAKKTA